MFMKTFLLVQEDPLASACSVIGFELLRNFYFGISSSLEKRFLTYQVFNDVCSHPERSDLEIRPLSRMRRSTLNDVSLKLALLGQE